MVFGFVLYALCFVLCILCFVLCALCLGGDFRGSDDVDFEFLIRHYDVKCW